MRSSRFPGKVLQKIFQRSLLENVLWNLPNDRLVVLTSIESGDDVLAEFCESRNILVSRGSETNVFDRFYQGIQEYPAPFYIRVTGDNPCLYKPSFPLMLQMLRMEKLDYCVGHELPLGGAAEAFTRESFLNQAVFSKSPRQMEHVTAAYYEAGSSFQWKPLKCNFNHLRSLRLTVDTPRDLEMFQAISRVCAKDPCQLSYEELEKILHDHQNILELNRGITQRTVYDVDGKK